MENQETNTQTQTTSLSDILCGLQAAVCNAVSTMQSKHLEMLGKFVEEDGKPLTKTFRFGSQTTEVPLMSLVPQANVEMDDVEIKFKAKIRDVAEISSDGFFRADRGGLISQSSLMLQMDGIKSDSDDTIEIKVHFKTAQIPEGVARIADEYNKMI